MAVEAYYPDERSKKFYPSTEEMAVLLKAHPYGNEMREYMRAHGVDERTVLNWPLDRGGTLVDLGIVRHMIAGNVVIDPFDSRLLQSNGYDVRLGENYYVYRGRGLEKSALDRLMSAVTFSLFRLDLSIYNPNNLKRFWAGPFATTRKPLELPTGWWWELQKSLAFGIVGLMSPSLMNEVEGFISEREADNIDVGDNVVVLPPDGMVLGHTMEHIGGRNVVTTSISGKSTMGRSMVEVCSDANCGDVGFVSPWTLELVNKSGSDRLVLVAGEPVATIQFVEVEHPAVEYTGAYQGRTIGLGKDSRHWYPQLMLPKARRKFRRE